MQKNATKTVVWGGGGGELGNWYSYLSHIMGALREKVAKSIKWEELLLKTTSNAIFNMKKFDLDES